MFEHFMCYTGGYNENDDFQAKLRKAYFDGFDAANKDTGSKSVQSVFSSMGLVEVKMPSLMGKNDPLKSSLLPDDNEIEFIACEMAQEHDWDDLKCKKVYADAFSDGAKYMRSIKNPD